LFDLRQEFPSQWHRFLHPTSPADGNVFELEMSPGLFPIRDADKILKVNAIWLLARCTDAGSYDVVMTPPLPKPPPGTPPPPPPNKLALAKLAGYGGLHLGQKDVSALDIEVTPAGTATTWRMKMTRPGGGGLQEDPISKVMEVEDLLLVLGYAYEAV
jgi:hypothetical protein